MTSEGFDWQAVLDTWDVPSEQKKADFLEFLYEMYAPEDFTYTGLWQRFQRDLAEMFRETWSGESDVGYVMSFHAPE
jgi:hypothetical protein